MIHSSPFPDVAIPDITITERVLRHATRLADKPALIEGAGGRTLTFGELDAAVRSLAGGFVARGRAVGEVVGIMAPNLPEYAILFHGAALAGGTVTTVNPTYTAAEVHHQLTDSGASLLVTIPLFLGVATEGAQGTGVEQVYVLGEAADGKSRCYGKP